MCSLTLPFQKYCQSSFHPCNHFCIAWSPLEWLQLNLRKVWRSYDLCYRSRKMHENYFGVVIRIEHPVILRELGRQWMTQNMTPNWKSSGWTLHITNDEFLPSHGVGSASSDKWMSDTRYPRGPYLTITVLLAGYLLCASPGEASAPLLLISVLLWQHHNPDLKNKYPVKRTLKLRIGWAPKRESLEVKVQVETG